MNSITDILMTIFSPLVFWPIIGGLGLLFVISLIFSLLSDKKVKQADESLHQQIKDAQEQLAAREAENNAVKDKFAAREADYRKQLNKLEEQISENEANRGKIKSLEASLADKDAALAKVKGAQEDFDKRLKALAAELENSKKETALKQEMYNGLKHQLEEAENQLSQMASKTHEDLEKVKKLQEEVEKNKKLQEEIKNLQIKLEEAAKKAKESLSAPQVKQVVVVPLPAQPEKKEINKPLAETAQIKSPEEKKNPPAALVAEDKPASLPEKPKETKEKPPAQVPQADKLKESSIPKSESEKSKLPQKSEAKVRLAQVMQEAAKVAAKMQDQKKATEAKNPAENIENKDQRKDQQKDKPQV